MFNFSVGAVPLILNLQQSLKSPFKLKDRRQAYNRNWVNAWKIYTPLWKIYCKPFTQGVLVSSGIALWTLPHRVSTGCQKEGLLDPLKVLNTHFKGSISSLRVRFSSNFADEISWGSSLQASTVPWPCRCRAGGGSTLFSINLGTNQWLLAMIWRDLLIPRLI